MNTEIFVLHFSLYPNLSNTVISKKTWDKSFNKKNFQKQINGGVWYEYCPQQVCDVFSKHQNSPVLLTHYQQKRSNIEVKIKSLKMSSLIGNKDVLLCSLFFVHLPTHVAQLFS